MSRLAFPVCIWLVLFSSCTSHLAFRSNDSRQADIAFEELRIELSDLKHALNSAQVEMHILEDKIKTQDNVIYSFKTQTANKLPLFQQLIEQIDGLEKKMAVLEKTQDKALSDMRQLASHANQTSATLVHQKERMQELERDVHVRLEEVAKLKSTLVTISKAMKQETASATYRVVTGDTLVTIARRFHTSVDTLKRLNQFENDRILVGQEIRVP